MKTYRIVLASSRRDLSSWTEDTTELEHGLFVAKASLAANVASFTTSVGYYTAAYVVFSSFLLYENYETPPPGMQFTRHFQLLQSTKKQRNLRHAITPRDFQLV